ncbi:hypothetical protein [Pedobacter sp. KACC 23697]|uniref:DUF3300 domain-containing protein n=1 Tax=Pedobacter sp. KACC 23697 TaxID=3149230 RepID=A0AAU7KBQ6_9SPHI
MKKLVLFAAVLMVSLFGINNAKAQVSLNVNIGSQPVWGPTGYDHVDYYYFPDIDAYYYVPSGQYIYANGGRWVWTNSLPAQYSNFDLFHAYKVVINKSKPYLRNNIYATRYGQYKNYSGHQTIIRDSKDAKYFVVKGHPHYNQRPVRNVTVINNRHNRVVQKNVTTPVQNNGRPQFNNGHDNRPERDNRKGLDHKHR